MVSKFRVFLSLFLSMLLLAAGSILAADEQKSSETKKKPAISLPEDMGTTMVREAAKVKEEIEQQAQSLFERKPLGWNLQTIHYLYKGAFSLPRKIPEFTRHVIKQGRILGVVSSLLIFIFIGAVLYSLLGQKRVLQWFEDKVKPLGERIPEAYYPYFQSGLKVVVSALIPLVLLGLFALINAMIVYRAAWFHLTGRLLGLWAAGALIFRFLKESLTRDIFAATARYGQALFRWVQLVLLFVLIGIALFWAAEAFHIRGDALALLKSAVSISIIVVLFPLFLKKQAFLSLFPELPYRSYQGFFKFINTYYYPLLIISL
ncbi:hypothetical protein ACFL0M_16075, partial [Thermodesulfobacteriota bacterium]